MSKKSDFFTAKLPRRYKRMIALGEAAGHYDKVQAKIIRQGFIEAHVASIRHKLKRNVETNRDNSSGE